MKFLGVLVAIAVLLAVAIHFLPVDTIIAERAASRSGYEAGEEYTDLEYRYYYNQLTENEKTAYHIICAQLTDFPGQILVPNLNTEELDAVFRAISYDNPEFFFLGNECKIYNVGGLFGSVTSLFLPEYTMTQEEYEAALTEVEDAAAQILSSAHPHPRLIPRNCTFTTPSSKPPNTTTPRTLPYLLYMVSSSTTAPTVKATPAPCSIF